MIVCVPTIKSSGTNVKSCGLIYIYIYIFIIYIYLLYIYIYYIYIYIYLFFFYCFSHFEDTIKKMIFYNNHNASICNKTFRGRNWQKCMKHVVSFMDLVSSCRQVPVASIAVINLLIFRNM